MAFRDPKHYPAGDHGGDPIDVTNVTPTSIQGKQLSYHIKMTVKRGGHIHILIYIRVNMCMYIQYMYIQYIYINIYIYMCIHVSIHIDMKLQLYVNHKVINKLKR